MKKILSLLCLLMLVIGSAWAGETFTFTFSGGKATSVPSEFFSHDASGKWSFNSKFAGCEYDGVSYSNGLKMEGTTKILFTTTEVSTVTIVQSNWSANSIKLDGEELAVADATECTGGRVYTIADVAAGEHNITRGSGESGLFLVKVEYADAPKTVTFINDANWANVNVYAWSGEGDNPQLFTAAWPGDALTANVEGNFVWSTIGAPEKIIFNNGTTQTADLEFKDGGVYNSTGRIITLIDFTATFKTDGMDEVWAYVWNSNEKALGDWPGTKMEGANGEFSITIKAEEAPQYIIFHNNAGEQTPDLAFEDGKAYEYMLNEYTATFTTDAGWENVNAYAWSGDGDEAKKFAGEWPGTALTATDGIYGFSIKAFNAPEKIQFNNGEAKTIDLAFINEKAYKWIVATPFYALKEGDTFAAGTTVDLGDATITYGVDGGAEFGAAAAAANEDYAGFGFMTAGNGENGSADGGTVYTIVPKYDGTITIGVRLNGGKKMHINEDGTDMEDYNGITIKDAANTSFTFAVKAGSTYKIWCDGSKLGFFGFDYKYEKQEPVDLAGKLVIGKVFYAGSTRLNGATPKNYMKHLYIELFNNSAETIDVAGTYIAMANTDGAANAWTAAAMAEEHPDSAVVKQIFQIPAGSPVKMEPGKSLVIANCAIDHSEIAEGNVNLSDADFEVKSANNAFSDHSDAVPALTIVKAFGTTDFINFLNPGPDGIVLLPASTDLVNCPETYGKGKTTGNLYTIVPLAGSIDAVDIVKQKTPSADDKRFADAYDAGFTCTKNTGTFNCQAVARKVIGIDGTRQLLQDTNNSSEDFQTLANIQTRKYGVDVVTTYSASFKTNAEWENVYAYAWTTEGETTTEFLGAWPGTKLTADNGVYTVTFDASKTPAFIIFNNGLEGDAKQQTEDLVFEDKKAYDYTVTLPVSNDFTSYIMNADLTGEGGFDATGTKGIDGSGIVKCANNAQFDFKQVINNLPAGQYKLTAQAAYRYSGSEADEYAAIAAGTDTKLATLYATVGTKTESALVMNRWDGASTTDYANGDGSTTVNELYVPNSSNAVKAWFNAGQYVNEVVFNLVADGDVTIGIVKTAQPEAGDYTVIGPWTLTRLGDAEQPAEQDFSATFKNDANWEAVYAYTWTGENEAKVEQLGAWPGTELAANAETGLYEVSGKNATLPANIIFHNNAGTQTADLVFEEGKQYSFNGDHDFAYGKYVLVNFASTKFWGTGNNWDTQATLVDHPVYQMLVPVPDGKYKLETQVSNGGTSNWFGGEYMDSGEGAAVTLTITRSAEPIGYRDNDEREPVYTYTIANGDNYYGNSTNGTLLGQNVAADSEDALWIIIPLDEAKAAVAEGTVEDPMDATIFIEDYNFNRNNRFVDSWQGWGDQVKVGNANGNMNAESYERTFDVYQELSGLPNGVYELNAQAAVTFHDARAKKPYDGVDMPVVYMNEETSEFIEMIEADQLTSQAQLGQKFNNGDYKVEPLFVQVTDGTLKIGAKSVRADIWAVWDNFVLTYYGSEATIDQVKNAALFAEVKELYDKLGLLIFSQEVEVEAVTNEIQSVYEANNPANITTGEAAKAAIEALTAAIDKGEASIAAKLVLPKMKQLTESTNVYTAEAYEEYYGQWYQKYEAGTLTKAEATALQDPFVVTGWHDNITCDNFLLSAWDTNPDFNNAAYYINTWSTEGIEGANNYAGAPFGVPFFEYWTGDGDSLGERTLTATMTGLEAGWYDVTAQVRVRAKNGYTAPAYGIKLQANGGDMTNVAAGDQIGESQFYLATFTAKGEVGEDGVLNIKFIVAADNNISWLSFKNVNYAKGEAVEYEYTLVGGYGTEEGGIEDPIFGTTWDTTISENNLVKGNDDVYTLVCNNVELTPGQSILYKVVRSHSWDINWGFKGGANADYFVNLPEGKTLPEGKDKGVFDITFKFNPVTPFENGFNVDCVVEYDEDTTTGISNIVREAIENGQVYNLNGQKVTKTQKGLYIINGRKQVVK